MKMTDILKKYVLPNLPYLIFLEEYVKQQLIAALFKFRFDR